MSDWIPPTGDNKQPAGAPSAPASGQPVQWPVAPPNYSQQQTKRRGIPVWVFVTTTISTFIVGLLIAAVFNIGSGVADGYAYDDSGSDDYSGLGNSKTFGTNGEIESIDASIGACFQGSIDEDSSQLDTVEEAGPCSRPHQLEIFALNDAPLGGDATYDAEALSYYADGFCQVSFEPYLGKNYFDSEYNFASAIPSRDAWGEGSRQVVCFVSPYAGETVDQSLRGIER